MVGALGSIQGAPNLAINNNRGTCSYAGHSKITSAVGWAREGCNHQTLEDVDGMLAKLRRAVATNPMGLQRISNHLCFTLLAMITLVSS